MTSRREEIIKRFIRYAKIDTQSSNDSQTFPSTKKQFDLANILVQELQELGLKDAHVDDKCYVYATLESNILKDHPSFGKVPNIGFIAHMDTSPDVSGHNVNPQIIENYQGGDIALPHSPGMFIRVSENPILKNCIGHTIITTDGTTLLGADDKSGVTAIMEAIKHLKENPLKVHGNIKIAFTPDEEVGQGVKYFDLKKFDALCAYTVDGGMPGRLNKETFSANSATVKVKGRDTHPGSAKDKMINASKALCEIISLLPKKMAPETTSGYEPFIHPHHIEGSIGEAQAKFLFRAFDEKTLDEEKKILENIIEVVKTNYKGIEIDLTIKESYRNMREVLEKNPLVLSNLWEAAISAKVTPSWEPIRGGTDGSGLSAMGLPTPNIYNGGNNFHSKTEWLSVNALEESIETLINLATIWVYKN